MMPRGVRRLVAVVAVLLATPSCLQCYTPTPSPAADCVSSCLRVSRDEMPACLQACSGRRRGTAAGRRGPLDTTGLTLKVFVYDLPSRFNFDLVRDSPFCRPSFSDDKPVPHWQTMYTIEVYIHEALLKSGVLTGDPDEADIFFIPMYPSCFLHSHSMDYRGTRSFIEEAVAHVRREHPFWDRSQGRDHAVVMAHDIGACLAPRPLLHNTIVISPLGDLMPREKEFHALLTRLPGRKGQKPLTSFAQPCVSTWKDIVVPPMTPYPRLAAASPHLSPAQGGDRPVLAFFRGTIWADESYSRGVRQQLKRMADVGTKGLVVESGASPGYYEELKRAKFCLAPGGWSVWSPRIFDALAMGCIPVILADGVELPYEDLIDYRAVSIKARESDVHTLMEKLRDIPPATIKAKQEAIRDVWGQLVYSGEVDGGDAFGMLLRELEARVPRHGWRRVGMDSWYL